MSFLHRHKLFFVVVILVGILLYAGFNFWIYRYAKLGSAPSPEALLETVSNKGAGFGGFQGKAQGRIPTTAPRPTGPGSYACDPLGNCNIYENPEEIGCPKTFADSRCLDSCGDTNVQCPK